MESLKILLLFPVDLGCLWRECFILEKGNTQVFFIVCGKLEKFENEKNLEQLKGERRYNPSNSLSADCIL